MWGDPVLDYGIVSLPALLVDCKGALSITDSEQCLIIAIFRLKRSKMSPKTLAEMLGWTSQKVLRIANSLENKGYLDRQTAGVWDFEPLLTAAKKLASNPG